MLMCGSSRPSPPRYGLWAIKLPPDSKFVDELIYMASFKHFQYIPHVTHTQKPYTQIKNM